MAVGVAGASRGDLPGSLTLLDLIEEHRSAFAYDWRTRFGLSVSSVGDAMTFGEAWLLTLELVRDPSSHVAAAVGGLTFPVSQEWLAIKVLVDNYVASKTQKRAKLQTLHDPTAAPPRRWGSPMSKDALRAVLDEQRSMPATDSPAETIQGG